MKAKERQRLKQNDFVANATRVIAVIDEHRGQATVIGVAALVILALAGGTWYWRSHTADEAGALLGVAQATAQATIAPASTLPGVGQPAGTFPTEQARTEAAIKAFQAVVDQYPSTAAGMAAEYNVASNLMVLGKFDEAATAFRRVAAGSASAVYKTMAEVGAAQALASAGKYDDAIKAYTDLSAERNSPLPVDALLMQLAQTDVKAGKTTDARATFKRVVDEFPDSEYVSDARQQMAALD
jgi:TolA-binding protein